MKPFIFAATVLVAAAQAAHASENIKRWNADEEWDLELPEWKEVSDKDWNAGVGRAPPKAADAATLRRLEETSAPTVTPVDPVDVLCPCEPEEPDEAWANHGEYVSCVTSATMTLEVPKKERKVYVKAAAQSDCGKKTVICGVITVKKLCDKKFGGVCKWEGDACVDADDGVLASSSLAAVDGEEAVAQEQFNSGYTVAGNLAFFLASAMMFLYQ